MKATHQAFLSKDFAKKERLQALCVLLEVFQQRVSLTVIWQKFSHISPFAKTLCYGVCRDYLRLERMAEQLVKKRLKEKDFDVWMCLLLGLYQLYALNRPDYAVVKETVDLLVAIQKTWAKGFVNGVLRAFCRQQASIIATLQTELQFISGHPAWLLARIMHDWPQDYMQICLANDQHPPMSLRVNSRLISVAAYLDLLGEHNIAATAHEHARDCVILTAATGVDQLPYFAAGYVSVQDAAPQLAADLLDVQPGLRVLDVCAAPGGKTCHLLEKEAHLQELIALDIEPQRLLKVRENLARLQLQATLITGDGTCPQDWWQGQLFDRILLDAPCSATGVIRRHPDIKWLRQASEVKAIAVTQRALLTAAWPMLIAGGLLLYATCSILRQENEQVIADFFQQTPDAVAENMPVTWGRALTYGRQILPGEQGMDGFYYCLIRKGVQRALGD